MVENAGIFTYGIYIGAIIILFQITYQRAYDIIKWTSLISLIYAFLFISFEEIERPPVKTLRRLKKLEKADEKELSSSEDTENSYVDSFFESYPEASEEIEQIVDLLIQNFILSWFQSIDANPSSRFPLVIKKIILETICRLQKRLSGVDEADFVALKLLPLLTKYFRIFCIAREAVLIDDSSSKSGLSNTNLKVAVQFNKYLKMHSGLSLRLSCQSSDIENHVRTKVDRLLPYLISEKELNSPYVSILLREILSTSIIGPLVLKFSDPDNWNTILISICEKKLEERDQVLEVRRILSNEVELRRFCSRHNGEFERLLEMGLEFEIGHSEKYFEDFLRQLSLLDSAFHLWAVRHFLLSNVLMLQDKKMSPQEIEELKRRTSLSLKLIQTRLTYVDSINNIGSFTSSINPESQQSDLNQILESFVASIQLISFDDILAEPMCLIYFESYLRSHPYHYGISYLRFYELVEKMKTPLEDSRDITVTFPPSEINELREAAEKFNRLDDLRVLDPGLVSNIQLFVSRTTSNDDQTVMLARRSMLLLQNEAKKALSKEFFEAFKDSKTFIGMVSDPEFIGTDVFSKLLDLPENNTFREFGTSMAPKKSIPGAHIGDALDNILKVASRRRKKSENQISDIEVIFGDEEGIPKPLSEDSLFGDLANNETDKAPTENSEEDHLSEDSFPKEFSPPNLSGSRVERSFVDLEARIAYLTIAVDQIEKELRLLDHLLLKAELTNNQQQLKLLKKSQRALVRDLENKELLRQQYSVQEDANSLFKKTKISIKSYYVDQPLKNQREVTYYLINVTHINNNLVTSWEIPRRFSEFYSLNLELKRKYKSLMKHLQRKEIFPEKIKISLRYHVSKSLLYEERKAKLEKYLLELLSIPEVCQDGMFRRFLTNSALFSGERDEQAEQNDASDLESSTASLNHCMDIDLNGIPATDVQRRKIDPLNDEDLDIQSDVGHKVYTNCDVRNYEEKSYVRSVCDFFISVFSLNKNNSGWLRGRAILKLLQQLLGTAADKYIKDTLKRLTSEEQITDVLRGFRTYLSSPNGFLAKRKLPKEVRTDGDIKRARNDSRLLIQRLFIEVFAKVVGFRNAQNAAVNIHEMLQNSYINASLLLEILDVTLNEVFFNEKIKSQKKDGNAI
ncbi:hypothetical protein HG535_0F00430 [Zygotorulaspora mrakii]|uniref:PXA domain-containing protein n=1 Tax=Zygotorulaspora mrakii TaxID=42260 RepID=A0A7H9B4Y7_ZYGMR|nr:uncharacterized protein HG535_0F00430 [Zygotorulaspora mrakii]QLG73533.1 hypothetical protein HG535_0F00430 [Zygotorulaspora mrakii]